MTDAAKAAAGASLEEALQKDVEATEEVKQAADELTIVRAVLDKVPGGTPPEDFELAAERAQDEPCDRGVVDDSAG